MPEVKFSIAKLEWTIFNFNTDIPLMQRMKMINSGQSFSDVNQARMGKMFNLSKEIQGVLETLDTNWCITTAGELTRVFIENKNAAMIFKLSCADIIKLRFK